MEALYPLIPDYDFFDLHNNVSVLIPKYNENPTVSHNILQETLEQFSSFIHIYTDASMSNSGTSCAYLVPQYNVEAKFKLCPETSIFSAEALAIVKSFEYISTKKEKSYVILSDSSLSLFSQPCEIVTLQALYLIHTSLILKN